MSVEANELCWFNGEILPMSQARIGIEDRGFQFGDGVYEALRIYHGIPFGLQPHLDRLEKSCEGFKLSLPLDRQSLAREMMKLISRSGVRNGLLYLQLTRGNSPRSHTIPGNLPPTLLFYARPLPPIVPIAHQTGAKIISVPDDRWRKCWIKTISLAASVLARFDAGAANAEEAVFVDRDRTVAECTSSNIFFIIDGKLFTHPVGARVLRGITRDATLECAAKLGINIEEKPITLDTAKKAEEVFITSTTRQIVWVKSWDDSIIACGMCGQITAQLATALDDVIARETQLLA